MLTGYHFKKRDSAPEGDNRVTNSSPPPRLSTRWRKLPAPGMRIPAFIKRSVDAALARSELELEALVVLWAEPPRGFDLVSGRLASALAGCQ